MAVGQARGRGKNSKLVAARERRVMPDGEPMQPQDVADQMNVFLWAEYQRDKTLPQPTTLDHRFVLAYEAGRYRWPSAHYRAAFRHVLRAATDAELGFTPKRRSRKPLQHANERGVEDASSGTQPKGPVGADFLATDGDVDRRGVLAALASPAMAALVRAVLRPFIWDTPQPARRPAATEPLTAALCRVRTDTHRQLPVATRTNRNRRTGPKSHAGPAVNVIRRAWEQPPLATAAPTTRGSTR